MRLPKLRHYPLASDSSALVQYAVDEVNGAPDEIAYLESDAFREKVRKSVKPSPGLAFSIRAVSVDYSALIQMNVSTNKRSAAAAILRAAAELYLAGRAEEDAEKEKALLAEMERNIRLLEIDVERLTKELAADQVNKQLGPALKVGEAWATVSAKADRQLAELQACRDMIREATLLFPAHSNRQATDLFDGWETRWRSLSDGGSKESVIKQFSESLKRKTGRPSTEQERAIEELAAWVWDWSAASRRAEETAKERDRLAAKMAGLDGGEFLAAKLAARQTASKEKLLDLERTRAAYFGRPLALYEEGRIVQMPAESVDLKMAALPGLLVLGLAGGVASGLVGALLIEYRALQQNRASGRA